MLIVFAEVNDYATDVSPDANWLEDELPLINILSVNCIFNSVI